MPHLGKPDTPLERYMAAFIDKSLIEGRMGGMVQGSFGDWFSDDRKQGVTAGVAGLGHAHEAFANKAVTPENLERIERAMESQAMHDASFKATENMVADIATTVVAVIVAVAVAAPTGGAGSAAVIAAALKTLSKKALLGDDYDMWGPEM
jgi:Mrp family chromosome partitioning ATPase